ncbi:MAG: hypothetical protein RIR15_229, partial [Actinomycetota bacterium]
MTLLFLITALLVIPAGFLIVIGDETNPLEDAKRIVKKNAKQSHDRTGLRLRLEELGRGTDKDYEEFRIKQYGYCASSSALSLIFFFVDLFNGIFLDPFLHPLPSALRFHQAGDDPVLV